MIIPPSDSGLSLEQSACDVLKEASLPIPKAQIMLFDHVLSLLKNKVAVSVSLK